MKAALKSLALSAFVLALSVPADASEGTWMFVGETKHGPVFVEKTSISRLDGNYRYWSRSSNFRGEGADLWEYNDLDCSGRKLRVLQATVYNKDGSSEPAAPARKWKFIEPGSVEETILIMLCK